MHPQTHLPLGQGRRFSRPGRVQEQEWTAPRRRSRRGLRRANPPRVRPPGRIGPRTAPSRARRSGSNCGSLAIRAPAPSIPRGRFDCGVHAVAAASAARCSDAARGVGQSRRSVEGASTRSCDAREEEMPRRLSESRPSSESGVSASASSDGSAQLTKGVLLAPPAGGASRPPTNAGRPNEPPASPAALRPVNSRRIRSKVACASAAPTAGMAAAVAAVASAPP
eukprot:scaffold9121_cov124-Isochrysis_galbana.AAC.2